MYIQDYSKKELIIIGTITLGMIALSTGCILYNWDNYTWTDQPLGDDLNNIEGGGSLQNSVFAYQGQYQDPETGLSFLGNRVYDPKTGQFLSQDPYPFDPTRPETINRYAYAHNDPVNYYDTTGLNDMVVHNGKTNEWAIQAAISAGFTDKNGNITAFGRKLAANISSFDEYHDKEWTIAPNHYEGFEEGMDPQGQGNALHFLNPNRNQLEFADAVIQEIIRSNGYVDPLAMIVKKTFFPVYSMKDLNDFNSINGSTELIKNPNAIRDEKIGGLSLPEGNLLDRLQYAVDSHDPRLMGLAMHEYQDSFAHAGFEKWHGFSTDNDDYCETIDSNPKCNPLLPEGNKRMDINSVLLSGSKIISRINKEGFSDFLKKDIPARFSEIRSALFERDNLMREGTKYWLNKFFTSLPGYYTQEIKKTKGFNKEEKTLAEPNKVLRPFEEIGKKTYILQAKYPGKAEILSPEFKSDAKKSIFK